MNNNFQAIKESESSEKFCGCKAKSHKTADCHLLRIQQCYIVSGRRPWQQTHVPNNTPRFFLLHVLVHQDCTNPHGEGKYSVRNGAKGLEAIKGGRAKRSGEEDGVGWR